MRAGSASWPLHVPAPGPQREADAAADEAEPDDVGPPRAGPPTARGRQLTASGRRQIGSQHDGPFEEHVLQARASGRSVSTWSRTRTHRARVPSTSISWAPEDRHVGQAEGPHRGGRVAASGGRPCR